jgi:pimeloyl-ACP methyl ester carboxylesterase
VKEDEALSIRDGSVRIGYAEYGDPRGRPLLFFHGWPCSRLQGDFLDEPARHLGIRVIAPDRPGIGKSSLILPRRLLDWPPMMAEFADALGLGRFAVMGVSGGGPYVLACAYAMRHRLDEAKIVCGAPPLTLFPTRHEMMLPYRALLRLRSSAPWALPWLMWVAGRVGRLPLSHPLIRPLLQFASRPDRELLKQWAREGCVLRGYREAALSQPKVLLADGEIFLADWGFDLADVQFPIQLWHGELDRNVPISMARQIAAALPSCVAHWLPREGHFSLPLSRVTEILSARL